MSIALLDDIVLGRVTGRLLVVRLNAGWSGCGKPCRAVQGLDVLPFGVI
jgi:hypothetical protein